MSDKPRNSVRKIIIGALQSGENDQDKINMLVQVNFPDWDAKRIKASTIVHRGYLKKHAEKVVAKVTTAAPTSESTAQPAAESVVAEPTVA